MLAELNRRNVPRAAAAYLLKAKASKGQPLDPVARYTGTVLADLEEDVYPRVTGRLVFMPLYAAAVMTGGSVFAAAQFGISFETALLLFAVITAAYVIPGGLKAVMYTDTLQGTIMLLGMIVLIAGFNIVGILTMMVVPLMTCSARLPVYTLVIGALIPAARLTQALLYVALPTFKESEGYDRVDLDLVGDCQQVVQVDQRQQPVAQADHRGEEDWRYAAGRLRFLPGFYGAV